MDLELKLSKFKLLILLLIPIIIYIVPLDYIEGRSFCIFYNLSGLECLGCGFTRAFFNMTRLNFVDAISYNKMILILGPLFVFSYFYELFHTLELVIKKHSKRKSILSLIIKFLKIR